MNRFYQVSFTMKKTFLRNKSIIEHVSHSEKQVFFLTNVK